MARYSDPLSGMYGRFVTGQMTKHDGSVRPVWGVFKNDPSIPAHLRVMYDMRIKQYRRFDITLPFSIRCGAKISKLYSVGGAK